MPCTMPPHLWLLRSLGHFCEEPHTGNFMRLIRAYLLVPLSLHRNIDNPLTNVKTRDGVFHEISHPHNSASRGVRTSRACSQKPLTHISVGCFQETLDVASHNVYNMHMIGRVRLGLVVRCDRSSATLGQYVWS